MSEETKDDNQEVSIDWSREITPLDFVRFAQAKGIGAECICTQSNWKVVDSWGQHGSPTISIANDDGLQNQNVPILLNICGNCGHTRSFIKGVVLQWLQENPQQEMAE